MHVAATLATSGSCRQPACRSTLCCPFQLALLSAHHASQERRACPCYPPLSAGQADVLSMMLLDDGKLGRNLVISAPTGSGKSRVAAALAVARCKATQRACLVVQPTRALCDQTCTALQSCFAPLHRWGAALLLICCSTACGPWLLCCSSRQPCSTRQLGCPLTDQAITVQEDALHA